MKMRDRWLLLALWAVCAPCRATQTLHESLEKVLERADAAWVVEVVAVTDLPQSGPWAERLITLTAQQTLFGTPPGKGALECRYTEGLPHSRGDRRVSPLVAGSGIEFEVKAGEQIIVLIAAPHAGSDPCVILRAEPIENLEQVRSGRSRQVGSSAIGLSDVVAIECRKLSRRLRALPSA